MKTRDYGDLYRQTFARLGVELTSKDGFPLDQIAAREKKLGLRLPTALRAYYLVAGRERSLNTAHNRLIPLKDLEAHAGKLVFMEENQWVVVWGVAASSKSAVDPAVYQGPIQDGEPSGWFLEHRKLSAFLVFMLHLQAAFGGGMPCGSSAPAPETLTAVLDKGWLFAGEVNGMRVYSRDKQAVCFLKWGDTWRLFASACQKGGLESIAADLGVQWD